MKNLIRIIFKPFINVFIVVAVVLLSKFELPVWAFLLLCIPTGVAAGSAEQFLRKTRPNWFDWN